MRGLQADLVSFVRSWLRRVRSGRGGHTGGSLGGFAWRGSLGGYARGGWLWGRGGALGARLGYSLLEFALEVHSGGLEHSLWGFDLCVCFRVVVVICKPPERTLPASKPPK